MSGRPTAWLAALAAIPPALAYLVIAIPSLAVLLAFVPLGQMADEPAHMMRVAGLADGHWVGRKGETVYPDGSRHIVTGVDADPILLDVMSASTLSGPVPIRADATAPIFAELGNIGTYTPTFYLPGAIGFAVARAAGAGPAGSAQAARAASALAFLLIAAAAVHLAVQGQAAIFTTLAVPMTLGLGATVNHDGLIIATSALAAALMTRVVAARSEDREDGPALVGSCVCLALVIGAKVPYFPMAAILLLPLGRPGRSIATPDLLRRIATIALVLLPGMVWAAVVLSQISAPYARDAYEAGPLWLGPRPAIFTSTDPAAQMRVLLWPPTRLFTVPFDFYSTPAYLLNLVVSAIGVLGWLSVSLHRWMYGWWGVVGLSVLFVTLRPQRGLPPTGRARHPGLEIALLMVAILATAWGIALSQYLTWTNVGDRMLQGPQGRYFLPLLPLLALLPTRDGLRRVPVPRAMVWAPALVALVSIVPLAMLIRAKFGPG